MAFKKKKKGKCCSLGTCGMGLLIYVCSERALVTAKMQFGFQTLLHISNALNKSF